MSLGALGDHRTHLQSKGGPDVVEGEHVARIRHREEDPVAVPGDGQDPA